MTARQASDRPTLLLTINDAGFFLSHRLPIAQAAAAAGYRVHVAAARSPAAETIAAHGLVFHPLPLSRRGLGPWREVRTFWSIYRLYRSLAPDLVHQVTVKPVLYGGLAARLAGVPAVVNAVSGLGYVFVDRGWKAGVLRSAIKAAYRIALAQRNGRVIFQNLDDREEFAAQGLVNPDASVLIKGSGVDLARFAPKPEPEGVPLVMLASRMLRDKGVGEFVEAARVLRKKGARARFVLVGDTDAGNPAAIARDRLKAWRREGVVEWWGHREDMPGVLAQAHVVCLPSYREGLPKILIEAAACGRPIVASDVPGCREIARAGDNALSVPIRDAEALARAIERLIADPDLRRRMGARGRSIAEAEFSVARVVRETLAVYNALLEAAGRLTPQPNSETQVRCSPS
ncbi:MAG: glycosyltransferase family 4 protein [Kiloniellaceae bacterium]